MNYNSFVRLNGPMHYVPKTRLFPVSRETGSYASSLYPSERKSTNLTQLSPKENRKEVLKLYRNGFRNLPRLLQAFQISAHPSVLKEAELSYRKKIEINSGETDNYEISKLRRYFEIELSTFLNLYATRSHILNYFFPSNIVELKKIVEGQQRQNLPENIRKSDYLSDFIKG
jgi:hypothetical protein